MGQREKFDAVGQRQVPPDPNLTAALSSGHSFQSALADVVDNSLDAGSKSVRIRVVLLENRIHRVLIGDDGAGMTSAQVDAAMSLGRPKLSGGLTLGHFGVGLKAASFSQAEVLTVLTRSAGSHGQGRRMRRVQVKGFVCDVLDRGQVEAELAELAPGRQFQSGTIIRWDALRAMPHGGRQHTDERLEQLRLSCFRHLGLVFHRFLATSRLSIRWDVLDLSTGESGPPMQLVAIDPFGYGRSGSPSYPSSMAADVDGEQVSLRCTIWPPRSESSSFLIGTGSPDPFQGFYVYRNDRLISYGGWHNVTRESRRRRLARVAIDITGHDDLVQISAEKDAVDLGSDLARAIVAATDRTGTSFQAFLHTAEEVFVEGNTRRRARAPLLPPGAGIDARVRQAIHEEAPIHGGRPPLNIRWTNFDPDDASFLTLDRKASVLWLNAKYRSAVGRGARGRLNDAPLIKALLYLLYEDVMSGTAVGAKERADLELWDGVLTAAAETEVRTNLG